MYRFKNAGYFHSAPQFAPDAGGAGDTPPAGDATPPSDKGGEGDKKPSAFDDFLKGAGNQSEFDRRVTKALETAKAGWQAEADKKIAEAKTEAERLAQMTAEQKAQHEQEKREKTIADREAQITRRELRATALETLAEKSLPKDLADILDYGDAEKCNASLASVEKAFRTAVQAGVDERLRGKTPKAGDGTTSDAAMRAAMGLPTTKKE